MGFFSNLFGIERLTPRQQLECFLEVEGDRAYLEWDDWRRDNPSAALDFRNWTPPPHSLDSVDLSKADLTDSNLHKVCLAGGNLSKTILVRVTFAQADLRNVNLSEATCTHTNFTDANLAGAYLTGCDLSQAVGLTAEQLIDTSFVGAKLPPIVLDSLCQLIRQRCS